MADTDTQQPSRGRNRSYRGRRRGNNSRGAQHPPRQSQPRPPPARTFGGQLTQLDPVAPTFVPASVAPVSSPPSVASTESFKPSKHNHHRNAGPSRQQRQRKVSLSRSTAPDMATRIHEDIGKGIYECAICTNEISRHSKVWSCRTCWTVFHIGCIKKWSKNEGSAVQRSTTSPENEANVSKQWRCPGCNLPKESFPNTYMCWCEKELDPKPIGGLPPHSCGQTCGRQRNFPKTCPHPCDLLCHAGPCPPCTAMAPKQSCYCGREETSRRCIETDYERGWSCGAICDDIMPCGEHNCQRPCHEGLCGSCEVEVDARCYCGKVQQNLKCSMKDEEKDSYDWTGCFDCHQLCDRMMDCGVHKCEKNCHPQDEETPHCSRSPDVVTHCHCGKTSIEQLNVKLREKCTDPIPSCQEPCGKTLKCGHPCTQICHVGDCLPCLRTVSITCRCGRNSFNTVCHQGYEEPPQCMRSCKALMNCGRHECGEKCCFGERTALERQATKRKLRPMGAQVRIFDDDIEPEHICTRQCGRLLKCGQHMCAELCHRGPCGSCRQGIFEEIACACGRTVLQPPLPCGTRPPPCNFPCERSKLCGHPQVAHNCHPDDEECPKCPFLTEKPCMCGKKTLKNQPCWRMDAPCGLVCGKTLKCGSHTCRKTCHKPGECEDAQEHCHQECGKTKKTCGHPCEQPCHAPSSCKEDKPCPFKIMITCDCQRKKEEVKCNARANIPEPPGRQTSLKCDDECARLERNRNLATALHISDDHSDDHVPYSTTTLNMYLEDVAWAHKQEDILRLFAADDTQKRYRFNPMKSRQRAFIHSLAEDFGMDGESLDPEPHRHVLLFKTPKFVTAPMKTLAQAARIKRAQLNIGAPVTSAPEKRPEELKPSYNGFLLTQSRFALTEDELRPAIKKAAPTTEFDIIFLSKSDSIALLPQKSWETPKLETLLTTLQPTLAAEITSHNFASAVLLGQFDLSGPEPKIIHQQGKSSLAATNGWSQVAAKRAMPMQAPQVKPVGQRPIYTVLGSRLAEAKKKREEEDRLRKLAREHLVDDWEQEMENENENEEQPVGLENKEQRVGFEHEEQRVGLVNVDESVDNTHPTEDGQDNVPE